MDDTDPIQLTFQRYGARYEKAKAVADKRGESIERYLIECIREGHMALSARALFTPDPSFPSEDELEFPTIFRRGKRKDG